MIAQEDHEELKAELAEVKDILGDISWFIGGNQSFLSDLHDELAKEGYNYGGDMVVSLLARLYKTGHGAMDMMEAMLEDVGRVLSGEE